MLSSGIGPSDAARIVGLDANTGAHLWIARDLIDVAQAATPEPGFASALLAQLRASHNAGRPSADFRYRMTGVLDWARGIGMSTRWRVAALASLALVIGSLVFMPRQVDARRVLTRAHAAYVQAQVASYALVEAIEEIHDPTEPPYLAGTVRIRRQVWFVDPSHWRVDDLISSEQPPSLMVTVRSGDEVRYYDASRKRLQIQAVAQPVQPFAAADRFGLAMDLHGALVSRGPCARESMAANDGSRVAGRDAYLIRLGPNPCPAADTPAANGPLILWVDKSTYMILRAEWHRPNGGVWSRREVISIQVDKKIDPQSVRFTPPQDTALQPNPRQTEGPKQTQHLDTIKRQAGFPLMVPTWIPPATKSNLTGTYQVGSDRIIDVTIDYVADDGSLVARVLEFLGPGVAWPGSMVEVRPSLSATYAVTPPLARLWWRQEGAYYVISSDRLPKEDLMRMAASMTLEG